MKEKCPICLKNYIEKQHTLVKLYDVPIITAICVDCGNIAFEDIYVEHFVYNVEGEWRKEAINMAKRTESTHCLLFFRNKARHQPNKKEVTSIESTTISLRDLYE